MPLLISNLSLPPDHDADAPLDRALRRIGAGRQALRGWSVLRRSVDARRRGEPLVVYTVRLELERAPDEAETARRRRGRQVALEAPAARWEPRPGGRELRGPVAVIGAGPAGLAAAWRLASAGYRPLVLERGAGVAERAAAVAELDRGGRLDPENNYCFGEGGAGCFSDGKLHTRRDDPRVREFLELLVGCGAPGEILAEGRPHVGSDRLPGVTRELRALICRLGGEVRTGARVEDFELRGGRLAALRLAGGERLEVGACLLAVGASARDTFAALSAAGLALEPRPLQMGLRLECSQAELDALLFGRWAGHERLGPAEFFLKSPADAGADAAHTFCMCPGGSVVPVATEPGGLGTNGASRRARGSGFANAAVVAAVPAAESAPAGVELQRAVERRVFAAGGSDYAFPCCAVRDYLAGREGGALPAAPDGVRRRPARLWGLLPAGAETAVRRAVERFAARMPPLGGAGAALYAAETRVGSPVRVLRDGAGRAPGADNLYPAGEGSGYAAGIASSAVDGMAAAERLVAEFSRPG